MRRLSITLLLVPVLLLSGVASANGWFADFFFADSSGNGSYEAMAISPEAVYDPVNGMTYIVFQGPDLDPYITAYDNNKGAWLPTYRVGENRLSEDVHGGPSLVIDQAEGYLYVFYGGHNKNLRYAKSLAPHEIDSWDSDNTIRLDGDAEDLMATYPQPWALPGGGVELFYRNHGTSSSDARKLDWEVARMSTEGTWTAGECVIDSTPGVEAWYVNSTHGPSGELHVAFVLRDLEQSALDWFVRRNVYYMKRDLTGQWVNVSGDPIGADRDLETMNALALVEDTADEYANQVVVRVAPDGSPALVYLVGTRGVSAECTWRYRRWNGTTWGGSAGIVQTDNLFDSADLAFDSAGAAHVYLTTGGTPDGQALPEEEESATRGGDIEHWVSDDGAGGWRLDEVVGRSPGAAERYNNPQIVARSDGDTSGVLFCEWNNDMSSFIHKLFLFVDGVYVQKEFTPALTRLAGANRIETAVKISQEAFPVGSDVVVLASSEEYADALCGVPLAQSYRAPVLLCKPTGVSAVLEAELRRLRPGKIIILGGEASLSVKVHSDVRAIRPSAEIQTIAGADRYETSALIATALAERRGLPETVLVASGVGFADALSVSPYAARGGFPVLLSAPNALPAAIESEIATLSPTRVVIVGGESALGVAIEDACRELAPALERWWGQNRYETALRVAEKSLIPEAGQTLARPVIASGEVFADAVPGGLLAARYNTVIVLTKHDRIPSTSAEVLAQATRVIEAYILGGAVAIEPGVENSVAALLHTVEAE
ncbi:MAG: cell wall-binding repeat-containing protein [Coriobacteriia bacterium]|nr:cell wall-binding repeat-containing protein [Coriobacteriia bacterium]MBN2823376.1 cell wall-binding repeat-containing protein [Coriobacteriia bacterium]